jgi:alpha-ribazole phosphatase
MRLYLIRHGETAGNVERRYVGHSDPPLSERGHAQAQALADRLAQVPLTAVLSSDLLRAQATARAIAAPHGLTVRTDSLLRECHFGAFEGLTYEEIAARHHEPLQAWLADPEQVAPPGGETLAQVRRRVAAALPLQDGAAVVTHGGPLRALLSVWTGRPFWELQVPVGSLTVVRWDPHPVVDQWPEESGGPATP